MNDTIIDLVAKNTDDNTLKVADNKAAKPSGAPVPAEAVIHTVPPITPTPNNNNNNNNNNEDDDDEQKANVILQHFRVCTWNLWAMPMASPRTLSNPYRCSQYLGKIAKWQKWDEFDGLIVCCFQELWAWRTGIVPPFILDWISWAEFIPCLGRVISIFFQLLSLLLGILPILKCIPITYCPKSKFLTRVLHVLPYSVHNKKIRLTTILDSGLVMCFNEPPDTNGFEYYTNHECEDSLANKGFLWASFHQRKLLVINTHLQASGSARVRELQLEQMSEFIKQCKKENKAEFVIICGDFNLDVRTFEERLQDMEASSMWLASHPNSNRNRYEAYDYNDHLNKNMDSPKEKVKKHRRHKKSKDNDDNLNLLNRYKNNTNGVKNNHYQQLSSEHDETSSTNGNNKENKSKKKKKKNSSQSHWQQLMNKTNRLPEIMSRMSNNQPSKQPILEPVEEGSSSESPPPAKSYNSNARLVSSTGASHDPIPPLDVEEEDPQVDRDHQKRTQLQISPPLQPKTEAPEVLMSMSSLVLPKSTQDLTNDQKLLPDPEPNEESLIVFKANTGDENKQIFGFVEPEPTNKEEEEPVPNETNGSKKLDETILLPKLAINFDEIRRKVAKQMKVGPYMDIAAKLNVTKASAPDGTERTNCNLDHIFIDFKTVNKPICRIHGKRRGLSDHYLVVCDFETIK